MRDLRLQEPDALRGGKLSRRASFIADEPQVGTPRLFLGPDGQQLGALRQARGVGRDEYRELIPLERRVRRGQGPSLRMVVVAHVGVVRQARAPGRRLPLLEIAVRNGEVGDRAALRAGEVDADVV